MIAAFPIGGCGNMPSQLIWKVCQASQGKTWRERVLSGEVFAKITLPEESRWFTEFAKARQLERLDPQAARGHLLAALEVATEEEDRLSLLASLCDHCLTSHLGIPTEHLETLMAAMRRDELGRDSAITKLYVCCNCLEDLDAYEELVEMVARLAEKALTPPTEKEIQEFLTIESLEQESEGPLFELLGEGEAPLATLRIQRGRFWFSGFELLCNVLVICYDLIEEEPWRWAFLQPKFGEWLKEWEKFRKRHGLLAGEDAIFLRRLASMIKG